MVLHFNGNVRLPPRINPSEQGLMPRYLITIEYDGSDFVGWQRQDNGPSVRAALEAAATAIIGARCQVAVQVLGGQMPGFMPRDRPPILICQHRLTLPNCRSRSMRICRHRCGCCWHSQWPIPSTPALMPSVGHIVTGYGYGVSRQRLNGGGSGLSAVNWMLLRWKPAQPI